jgi:GTP-binding protein Era
LRAGVIAIVGRVNVGKSTLLNTILGEKVAIVSPVPQTSRLPIRGIFTDSRGQVVFVDTPGLHSPKHKLGKQMVSYAKQALFGCDAVIHLVDASEPIGREEELIVDQINRASVPVVVGLNKIDKGKEFIPQYIQLWREKKKKPISELTDSVILITLSGLRGTNVDRLLEVIFSLLPQGPALYPQEMLTDLPIRLNIAEIIREKLFERMRQEVPHFLAVLVEEMIERSNRLTYINAKILVEKSSHKKIVIGKDGRILKHAGQEARKEIEGILKKKVYLDLWVKIEAGWRQNPLLLKKLGYV